METKTIIVLSFSLFFILVGISLILIDKKESNIKTSSTNSWNSLLYYFFKEVFKTNPNLPPNIDIDCVITNIIMQYPNPNDTNNLDENILKNILSSCMTGTGKTQAPTPTLPFNTTIPSSWNDDLTSNLRDMIPSTFSDVSKLNVNCLVNFFKKSYPNPTDFIKFMIQLPLDKNNNPTLPTNIITNCKNNNLKSKIGFALIALSVVILFSYYINKKAYVGRGRDYNRFTI